MSQTRNDEPFFMGGSEVAVPSEENGITNKCLDISDFSVSAINRELVNLENAAVNIDNSSDVIIGPVTQFNVNGNVTIYQNKDGIPIGIEDGDGVFVNGNKYNGDLKAQPSVDKSQVHKEDQEVIFNAKRKFTVKLYLGILVLVFLVVASVTLTSVFLLQSTPQEPEDNKNSLNDSSITTTFGIHLLIRRKFWNARNPKRVIPMQPPVDFVVIKHTAGGTCNDFISCAKKLQDLQSASFEQNLDDLYCSFVVGGDGNIYEGRGWTTKPEYLEKGIDIVFPGNFVIDEFTPVMINATRALLEYGETNNFLTKDYRLVNHNQTEIIYSPGKNIIKVVKTWPHYDPRNYMGVPLVVRN